MQQMMETCQKSMEWQPPRENAARQLPPVQQAKPPLAFGPAPPWNAYQLAEATGKAFKAPPQAPPAKAPLQNFPIASLSQEKRETREEAAAGQPLADAV